MLEGFFAVAALAFTYNYARGYSLCESGPKANTCLQPQKLIQTRVFNMISTHKANGASPHQ